MSKCILYVAASIDGFIAKSDGDVSWLVEDEMFEEDNGFLHFMQTIGCIIMGSKTYLQIIHELAKNSWPYLGKKTYVFSKRDLPFDENVCFVKRGVV